MADESERINIRYLPPRYEDSPGGFWFISDNEGDRISIIIRGPKTPEIREKCEAIRTAIADARRTAAAARGE